MGSGATSASAGGRCLRARQLAERRAGGEELGDYESRLLSAHLEGCSRCRDYVEGLGATVVGGQGDGAAAKVDSVEEERPSEQEQDAAEPEPDVQEPQAPKQKQATEESPQPTTESSSEEQEHAGSDVDAMGQPKRREVVGQGYGPTKLRQLFAYAAFGAVLVGLYFGAKFAISELDQAPAKDTDQAPWSKPESPQTAPVEFQ